MNKIITSLYLFLFVNFISSQIRLYEQYPSVVDSMIIQKRSNEKVIVVENNAGIRKEFWFDNQGNRKFDVIRKRYYNFDKSNKRSKVIEIDTVFHLHDAIKIGSKVIPKNPEIRDSTIFFKQSNIEYFLLTPDKTIYVESIDNEQIEQYKKHIITRNNSTYISQIDTTRILLDKLNEITFDSKKTWYVENNTVYRINKGKRNNALITQFVLVEDEYQKIINILLYRTKINDLVQESQYFPKYKISYCNDEKRLPKKMRLNFKEKKS